MDKHLDLSSQTELVGHSTVRPLSLHFRTILDTMVNFCHILLQVLASPYSNPQFGQFLTTYGQPAMVCYQHIATAYENQSHSNCLFLNIQTRTYPPIPMCLMLSDMYLKNYFLTIFTDSINFLILLCMLPICY